MNLPNELDPIKACKAGEILKGNLKANSFTRVEGFDQVEYCFHCSLNDRGEPVIELQLKAKFKLICQRCNQPMLYDLDEKIVLEETQTFDPALVIEDELILGLPMIPLHAEKDCSFSQNQAYYGAQNKTDTHKPFANLGKVIDSKE